MSDETRYVRRDVLNTMVDEDLILFDEQAGTYYATSEVGAAIWEHLAEPLTLAELCAKLASAYQVHPDQCKKDTKLFVDKLIASSIVSEIKTPRD